MSNTIITQHGEAFDPTPTSIELQISARRPFSKQLRKRVKAAGGTYSECRGRIDIRYVDLPYTPEGNAVADAIMATGVSEAVRAARAAKDKGAFTVILRSRVRGDISSWIQVQYADNMADARAKYDAAIERAVERGYLVREDRVAYETRKAREAAQARRDEASRYAQSLVNLANDAAELLGHDGWDGDITALVEALRAEAAKKIEV